MALHSFTILRTLGMVLMVVVLAYSWLQLTNNPSNFHLIMAVNLVFHEAGHVFLYPFGHYLYVLGGTLFEIGIPLIVTSVFLRQGSYAGATFAFWWLATALYSVSVYVADAPIQALPLLTGDPDSHDWAFLLGTTGLLPYASNLALLLLLGSYVSLVLGLYCSYRGLTTVPKS
jgi:hypothetical protein